MTYTREQLDAMTDDQLCEVVKQLTGLDVNADGNGMLAVMNSMLEKNDWGLLVEDTGTKGWWYARALTPRGSWSASHASAPRALFIAAVLAGQEDK